MAADDLKRLQVWLVENPLELQVRAPEGWCQQGEIVGGQSCQKPIADGWLF
jgi:hypothetical protein